METPVASRERVLVMAIEVGNSEYKVAFTDLEKQRITTVPARNMSRLDQVIREAKAKFGLPAGCKVVCCYEAGRDGFWLHRALLGRGITNTVVDPASIEVNRRHRRVKTDRLDAQKLCAILVRYTIYGERAVWKVVAVPTPEEEDARRLTREKERLRKERTGHLARIRSLLALHGIKTGRLMRAVAAYRDWAGQPLPPQVAGEIEREFQRLAVVLEQMKVLQAQQARQYAQPSSAQDRVAAKLLKVKAVGPESAGILSAELFAWRNLQNRRQVGALTGLTGSPYNSGMRQREQGISKAGNRRVRHVLVELAWQWMRHQPQSALTQWYQRRFGGGSARQRRVGIVALARKLAVALWKYVKFDALPLGAVLKA